MEYFPATDQKQMNYIEKAIDLSDYYIVIIRQRYGSIGETGFSYTEQEYNYAISKQIPVIGFIYQNPIDEELQRTDILNDSEQAKKLEKFIEKVSVGRQVKYWSDDSDLAIKVLLSLNYEFLNNPRPGWIRSNYQVSDKSEYETRQLVLKNQELENSNKLLLEAMTILTTPTKAEQDLDRRIHDFLEKTKNSTTRSIKLDLTEYDQKLEKLQKIKDALSNGGSLD